MKKIKKNISSQNKWILFYLVATLVACFSFGQLINSYGTYTLFTTAVGICLAVGYYIYEKRQNKKEQLPSPCVAVICIGVFVVQCFYVIVGEMINCVYKSDTVQWPFSILLVIGIITIAMVFCRQYKKGKIDAEQMIAIIIFITFLFRLIYTQFTWSANLSRQNDTIAFTNGGGHLGYIWHLWANGQLPQCDPRSMWEFSQPPFYYIVSAIWVKINTVLGVPLSKVAENIQILSLFFVTVTTIYLDKIMIKMKLSATKRLWGIVLFSCIPYFTYLAGAVNNDVLMLLLTVMTFYYAMRWYESPSWHLLIIEAILTGLLVMTKSSGALIAPAIVVVFLFRMVKDKNERVKRLVQYLVFGVISLPIGLWWNVRNMMRFDMPFLYVNEPSKESVQYIPDYSIWQRLFDVDQQLNHLYTELVNTNTDVDHNIIISTIKTLVFTQSHEMMKTDVTYFYGLLLFVYTVIFVIVLVGFGFVGLIKANVDVYQKLMWLALSISYIVFYLYFNISYPFVHTMHARYLLPLFVVGVPWMILGMSHFRQIISEKKVFVNKIMFPVLVSYAISYYGVLQTYMIQILIQAGEQL